MIEKRGRTLVLLAIILTVFVTVSLSVTNVRSLQNAQARARQMLLSNAAEQVSVLSEVLYGQYQVLETAAASLAMLTAPRDNQIIGLMNAISRNSRFTQIYFVRANGHIVSAFNDDISGRADFIAAIGGARGMENVVSVTSGIKGICLSVPYRKDGAVRGVVCGIYSEKDLRALLAPKIYRGQGYAYIVNDAGQKIVFEQSEEETGSQQTDLSFAESAAFSDGFSYQQLLDALRNRESGTFTYQYEGVNRVTAFAPFQDERVPKNNWSVVNVVAPGALDEDVAAERRQTYGQIALLTALMLIEGMLLAAFEWFRRRAVRREAEQTRIREERYRIVARQSGRGVFEYDVRTHASHGEALTDAQETDPVCAALCGGRVDADSADAYRAFFAQIDGGARTAKADVRITEAERQTKWYRLNATTLFDDAGDPVSAVVSFYDCTEACERELAYAKWRQEVAAMPRDRTWLHEWNLTRNVPISVSEGDFAPLKAINTFEKRVAAYADAKLYDGDRAAYLAFMNRERLIGAYHSGLFNGHAEYREIQEDGGYRWRRVSIQMVAYPDSGDIKAYLMLTDIDEKKREALALIEKSERDPLTGILNREAFIRHMGEMIEQRPHETHVLMLLDIDFFKQVNDTFGHSAGDKLLCEFAQSMRSMLHATDLVGRIGGDEFMICLAAMPYEGAIRKKAAQLLQALSRRMGKNVTVSASVGIAVFPRDGAGFDELYRRADAALYHIKKSGKNGYAFYRADMVAEHPAQQADEARFIAAGARTRVLVACEDEALRGEFARVLSDRYDVVAPASGSEAVERIARGDEFSALVIDYDDAVGANVLAAQREAGRLWVFPVVAASRALTPAERSRALEAGVAMLVEKPVDAAVLRARVDMVTAIERNERERVRGSFERLQSAEEERYREVLNATGTAVFIYDLDAGGYTADPLAREYVAGTFDGRPLERVLAEDDVATPDDIDRCNRAVVSVARGEKDCADMNVLFKTPSGERHWFLMRAVRLKSQFEMTRKLLIMLSDIDEKAKADELLKARAERDTKTGLYNGETFFEKAELAIGARDASYYTMMAVDLDSFKAFNDEYGREMGDRVLRRIGAHLNEFAQARGGLAGRVMADIFAALYRSDGGLYTVPHFEDLPAAAAAYVASAYRIGRYVVSDRATRAEDMFDRAMIAKDSIKGRYDVRAASFSEQMRLRIFEERSVINEMESALESGQFEVWFQPQYNHATARLIGAEALVRWRRPGKGVLSPGAFIDIFEKNGFIYALDKCVWAQACAFLREQLDARGDALPVSVNVSRYDIFMADFFETITGAVTARNIPPRLLHLEITETAFSKSTAQIIEMVKRLKAFGFVVAIDDFGSGYSSLNTLKDVPADLLKMDMRFFETRDDMRRSGSIISSVVVMARRLGMAVIAEGVETRAQADYLKSIGCERIQGYLYAQPMPAAEYAVLNAHSALPREIAAAPDRAQDCGALWDPASLDTFLFNRVLGGAAVVEYCDGRTDMLRVNEQYLRVLGTALTQSDVMRVAPIDTMSETDYRAMTDAFDRAIATGGEATFEVRVRLRSRPAECVGVRGAVRAVARDGSRHTLIVLVKNTSPNRVRR